MRIFLTGCAGFIGHHLARVPIARGDALTVLDDLNPYYVNRRAKLTPYRHAKLTPGI